MDCIFCQIATKKMPAYIVYEDDNFLAILDKFPATLGHIVILTKKHYENIYDLPEYLACELMPLAQKIANSLSENLDITGLNILQNNGAHAGQTVFHYHLHLIPRLAEDLVTIQWQKVSPTEEAFKQLATNIAKGV